MVVLAAPVVEIATMAARAATRGAEQGFEEIAVIRVPAARSGAAELETGAPIGRRPELLTRPRALTELVVCGALLGALENFVGFAEFLEARRIRPTRSGPAAG